ncbi:MAG: glycosyltransferase [Chthonomonadetes bacterium]|nr:glycosyltransferase [Chthonomonadetes bacterium]
MKSFRILQTLAGLHLGGAEQLVASLSAWLQSRGHEVVVANLTAERAMMYAFERENIRVVQAEDRRLLSRWYPCRLAKLIHQFRPDVVHCHNTAWLKTASACWWTGTPCVFTLHNYHDRWLQQHARRLRSAARLTSFCVGVAPGIEQLFTQILGVPAERTAYIRNGIADVYMSNPPAPDWGMPIPKNAVVVAMVARFDGHQKDQSTLVRAVQMARQSVPNLHLVLIGDGPHRPAVEVLVDDLNARGYVHFLGMRGDVHVLLHHVDLFVLSSKIEGESLAILEAMSAQRPIIATAVGGTPSLLANGECGVLVPPGDAQAMAQAIVDLLQNREKAQQLAAFARQRFLREYTIDRMAERYLELYVKAIASRR